MKSLQLDSPHAIVVIGIQGSGKSFFAKKFADTFNAPFIDESIFTAVTQDQTTGKRFMHDVVDEILKTGKSIVIERASSTRVDRTELAKRLKHAGYIPMFVWVQVDSETAMNRIQKLYKTDAETFTANMRSFSPPHPLEKAVVISGKHTFATQAKAILKRISTPRHTTTSTNNTNNRPPERPQQPPVRGQIIVR